VFFGGDYNPEQWPEDVWLEDARLMRDAGVNLVSLGVFSWASLEPRPGTFDFSWLDRVVDLLYRHGVSVNLGTATASPPPWLAHDHPETLPVGADGIRLWPGSRQHYCPSSPAYRRHAARLVQRVAEHYCGHPALAMWHVNNEYGCHVSRCYCDVSAEAFRHWLRERYGDIRALNDAWGTAFWSQRYSDFFEINPPRSAPTFVNPTQVVDFSRFSSDALLQCFELERSILKEITPETPVTTNFMGFWKPVDYWTWARREDVVSHDHYPDPADTEAHIGAAMSYDLMRSLGEGRPWLLMEQSASHVNWRDRNLPKQPNQMRLWSYQAVARGADGVMFFQWRASSAGAEKFHAGMVPHAGTDSRIWREVSTLGHELTRVGELDGTVADAEVAILFDWNSWWALETSSMPSIDVRQLEQLYAYYRPLYEANVPVDFVSPAGDLSPYRLVLAPNLYLASRETARRVADRVATGATFVTSFFSGIVDENDHVYLGGYPGAWAELLGIAVEEFAPFPEGHQGRIRSSTGEEETCSIWSEVVRLRGAEELATFQEDGICFGRPAATRNAVGAGYAYYIATRPSDAFMRDLLAGLCREADIEAFPAPAGVEVARRRSDASDYKFYLNHRREPVVIDRVPEGVDLVSGSPTRGELRLEPFDAAVIRTPGGRRG
jgi:beta-galactosidase